MKITIVLFMALLSMYAPQSLPSERSEAAASFVPTSSASAVLESVRKEFYTEGRMVNEFEIHLPEGKTFERFEVSIPSLRSNPHPTKENDYYCFHNGPEFYNDGETVVFCFVDFDVEFHEMGKARRIYANQRDRFFQEQIQTFLRTAECNTNRKIMITVYYQ